MSMTLSDEVEAALALIRPALEVEGGSVELAGVQEGVARVRVRLPDTGGAPAPLGLLLGIQRTVTAAVPAIRAVISQDLLDAGYPLEQLAAQMKGFQVSSSRPVAEPPAPPALTVMERAGSTLNLEP